MSTYLLVIELVRHIVIKDSTLPYGDPRLKSVFEKLQSLYRPDETTEQADFSERLLGLVNDIAARRASLSALRSTGISLPFDELWPLFFVTHVHAQPSFEYILGRTFMRPREILTFVRECINVAINRNHERVAEDDILYAEKGYSEEALVDISLEVKDVEPAFADVPYAFIGSKPTLSRREVETKLSDKRRATSHDSSSAKPM